jgi:polyisoprenoid-binding protein YceI
MTMTIRPTSLTAICSGLLLALSASAPAVVAGRDTAPAMRLVSSKVSLAGTSNIHAYTATTTAARLVRLELAAGALGDDVLAVVEHPDALAAFEIAIPVKTLASNKDGLDKNMQKALKAAEHPDITFRLSRLEAGDAAGTTRGIGMLRVAGVEREVTLPLKATRAASTFTVTGEIALLMTDFGITPPKAMLGMLKTDPKVIVTFETVFGPPQT